MQGARNWREVRGDCAGARPRGNRRFDELYRDNVRALRAFLKVKLQNPDDVEDVLQDVYVRLSNISDDVTIGAPKAFIFKIAANLAIDLLRQRRRHEQSGAGASALDAHDNENLLPSDEPSAEQVMISRETARRVLDGLERLSAKTKRVFIAHRFEGQSYAEIARELKVTVKAVEYHMTQALLHLRIARGLD